VFVDPALEYDGEHIFPEMRKSRPKKCKTLPRTVKTMTLDSGATSWANIHMSSHISPKVVLNRSVRL